MYQSNYLERWQQKLSLTKFDGHKSDWFVVGMAWRQHVLNSHNNNNWKLKLIKTKNDHYDMTRDVPAVTESGGIWKHTDTNLPTYGHSNFIYFILIWFFCAWFRRLTVKYCLTKSTRYYCLFKITWNVRFIWSNTPTLCNQKYHKSMKWLDNLYALLKNHLVWVQLQDLEGGLSSKWKSWALVVCIILFTSFKNTKPAAAMAFPQSLRGCYEKNTDCHFHTTKFSIN